VDRELEKVKEAKERKEVKNRKQNPGKGRTGLPAEDVGANIT
jgi:hypothetical protein